MARGYWKGLHDTLLREGLLPVPYETSAYYLPGKKGGIAGLLGCHVDDLLWAVSEEMQETMLRVQKVKFGLVERNELEYCGRIINQSGDYKVTCPNVLDRTKNIFIIPDRRKNLPDPATPGEIAQLRAVAGSLSWLARVCRPDISFGVNQLRAVQQKAQVRHLMDANKILNYAMKDCSKGIVYPKNAFDINEAILVSINDASHDASLEGLPDGTIGGHRSQSGRILTFASPDFVKSGEGKIYVLEWHSTCIKRVCRSTLQAETLSLQLGSEEAEHVRQFMYTLKNLDTGENKSKNRTKATDHMTMLWMTDCGSLQNPAISMVSDKHLAIDLNALRQEIWKKRGEAIGNPTYADELRSDDPTKVAWVCQLERWSQMD